MSIDKKELAYIEHLARIDVPEDEQQKISEDLNNILDWIDTLQQVNTDNIEPLVNISSLHSKLELRQDTASGGSMAEKVISNAPYSLDNSFVVPKVVE